MARQKRPTVPHAVSQHVVNTYVKMRRDAQEDEKAHTYTSARTLLGILRLAQALARLRLADIVETGDVDEAVRLMEQSKASLLDEEQEDDAVGDRSVKSKVFRIIKDLLGAGGAQAMKKRSTKKKRLGKGPGGERDMDVDEDEYEDEAELSMITIRERVLTAGYSEHDLMETITAVSTALSMRLGRFANVFPVRGYGHLDEDSRRVEVEVHQRPIVVALRSRYTRCPFAFCRVFLCVVCYVIVVVPHLESACCKLAF